MSSPVNLNEKKDEKKSNLYNIILFKYFNAVIIVLVVIILLVGSVYLIRPKYAKITSGVEEINKSRSRQKGEMTTYLSRLSRYKQEYYNIGEQARARVNQFLPSRGNDENLFADMESLINKRGLILRDIEIAAENNDANSKSKPQTPVAKGALEGLGTVRLTLSISGVDYKNLKQLLETIENNLRLMDIIDMNFFPDSNSVNLTINTYYNK